MKKLASLSPQLRNFLNEKVDSELEVLLSSKNAAQIHHQIKMPKRGSKCTPQPYGRIKQDEQNAMSVIGYDQQPCVAQVGLFQGCGVVLELLSSCGLQSV
jgi:hypothetical protein